MLQIICMFPFHLLNQISALHETSHERCAICNSQELLPSVLTVGNDSAVTQYPYSCWLPAVTDCHPTASSSKLAAVSSFEWGAPQPQSSQGDMKLTGAILILSLSSEAHIHFSNVATTPTQPNPQLTTHSFGLRELY
jgi:hypothetical protein